MDVDNEIRQYLWDLLDHESECELEQCSCCVAAREVYGLVRSHIFGGAEYPGVAIAARSGAAPHEKRSLTVATR